MKKGTMAIFPILLIALSMVGFAYAHWQQILYINGTIETGTLCVGLRDTGVNDTPGTGDPGFDTVTDKQVWYDKDVGKIESFNLVPKCVHEDVQYFEKERIVITNAYPSYAPGWWTEVANCGTIPVKIDPAKFKLTPPIGDWPCWIELLKWEKWRDGELEAEGASHPIPGYTNYGAGCYDALVAALMKQQLDPCDTIEIYIELHTTQEFCEMPMGATFTFDIEIGFTQWNCVN